ncbi:hypothetical protein ACXN5S_13885 [Pseudoroseicyclus sp. H15]
MTGTPARPTLITSATDLPTYPIPTGQRLPGQYFLRFETQTYFNSEFYLRAEREVRACYLELIFHAQHQSPLGTLPVDPLQQARLLRIGLDEWQALCARDPSPLWRWEPCMSDRGDRRLMHDKVLDVLLDQITKREAAEVAKGNDAVRKRLDRVRFRMRESRRFAEAEIVSDTLVERIDAWLIGNVKGRRMAQHFDAAFDKAQREGWTDGLMTRR